MTYAWLQHQRRDRPTSALGTKSTSKKLLMGSLLIKGPFWGARYKVTPFKKGSQKGRTTEGLGNTGTNLNVIRSR